MLVALAGAICRPGGGSTPQASDPVLIGAGDIADGFNLNLASSTATAVLLDANPAATVFAAGDLAYDNGSDGDFAKSYDPPGDAHAPAPFLCSATTSTIP